MFTNEDIARYYHLSEVHYKLFWNLDKARSLHYGYWDSSTKNFNEALLNINRVMADRAEITKGMNVLDAGCGVGGSSLWLAANRECSVTGISLSDKQVQKAADFARQSGLDDKVKFEQRDFTTTGYPSESFDIVWAIESVCHAYDKSEFLKEAFRVLKKGGRLIVADFFKTDGLTGANAQKIQDFANSWAVTDFATWKSFHQQLKEVGFGNIENEDASKAVMPSAKRLYRFYFLGKPASLLYRLFKGKPTSLAANNVDSAYLQYITLRKGLWKYRIVTAIK